MKAILRQESLVAVGTSDPPVRLHFESTHQLTKGPGQVRQILGVDIDLAAGCGDLLHRLVDRGHVIGDAAGHAGALTDILIDLLDALGSLGNIAGDLLTGDRLLLNRRGDCGHNIVGLVDHPGDLLDLGDCFGG